MISTKKDGGVFLKDVSKWAFNFGYWSKKQNQWFYLRILSLHRCLFARLQRKKKGTLKTASSPVACRQTPQHLTCVNEDDWLEMLGSSSFSEILHWFVWERVFRPDGEELNCTELKTLPKILDGFVLEEVEEEETELYWKSLISLLCCLLLNHFRVCWNLESLLQRMLSEANLIKSTWKVESCGCVFSEKTNWKC